MTIKWVKSDPLVMNGEPFCYGTRLTVRNLLEMRAHGLAPAEIHSREPGAAVDRHRRGLPLRRRASRTATPTSSTTDGALDGPGFTPQEATALPEHLRDLPGIVVTAASPPAPDRDARRGASALIASCRRAPTSALQVISDLVQD